MGHFVQRWAKAWEGVSVRLLQISGEKTNQCKQWWCKRALLRKEYMCLKSHHVKPVTVHHLQQGNCITQILSHSFQTHKNKSRAWRVTSLFVLWVWGWADVRVVHVFRGEKRQARCVLGLSWRVLRHIVNSISHPINRAGGENTTRDIRLRNDGELRRRAFSSETTGR